VPGKTIRFLGTLLVVLSSVAWLAAVAGWIRGARRVPVLREAAEVQKPIDRYPSVSVVVAARDEEAGVGAALGSVLDQDYPGSLEVVAVNDRSTDRTGTIIADLAAKRPDRLRPLEVEVLPEGWLGKNHALYRGAAEAGGEWLLFTDADVRFSPDCLELAMRYAEIERLDHLALAPELLSRGVALKSFVTAFTFVFGVTQRPWRASDPDAREAVGVGSFNLLKTEAYHRAGTHRAIRLRPDDDMRLARLLKDAGYSQDVAYGAGCVSVEWHQTLGGAVKGLEKSIFPGVDYKLSAIVAASLLLFLTNIWPFAGVFLARRRAMRLLFGADVLAVLTMYAYGPRVSGYSLPLPYAALHPFGMGTFIYAALRSAYVTLVMGGIQWRGTFYPLRLLKGDTRSG
jgi:glycosyltransferase involved in cell wall biosynthesis